PGAAEITAGEPAAGARTVEAHGDLVTGQCSACSQRKAVVAAIFGDPHGGGGDVIGFPAFLLALVVAQFGSSVDDYVGHRLCPVDCVRCCRGVDLNDGGTRAGAGDDDVPGVVGKRPVG